MPTCLCTSFHQPSRLSTCTPWFLQRRPAVFGAQADPPLPHPGRCFLSHASVTRAMMALSWIRVVAGPEFNPWDKEELVSQISGKLHPRVKRQNVPQDLRCCSYCGSRQCSSCSRQACPPRGEIHALEGLGQGRAH
jgi:hypothetical protein